MNWEMSLLVLALVAGRNVRNKLLRISILGTRSIGVVDSDIELSVLDEINVLTKVWHFICALLVQGEKGGGARDKDITQIAPPLDRIPIHLFLPFQRRYTKLLPCSLHHG